MNRVCGIYTITSPSGRIYVGQSRHVYSRFRFYRYDKRKGTQPKLDCSFFKYSVLAHRFQLVHWLPLTVTQERLDCFEQLYMDNLRAQGHKLLNSREGGYRGKLNQEAIEKTRAKLRGHVVSTETREKLRRASTGRQHTAIAKEKAGKVWRGKKRGPMSEAHKRKLSVARMSREPWNKGKQGVYSEETIQRIKAARAVQPKIVYTEEIRAGMAAAARKRGITTETRQRMTEVKLDMYQKGLFAWPNSKLTPAMVRSIREKHIPKRYGCVRLAREFDVSKSLVKAIIAGKAWKHVNVS